MFFLSDLILESEIISADRLGKVADIVSAFLDTQMNLITATNDGLEFNFQHDGSKFKIRVDENGNVVYMSKKNAKEDVIVNNPIDGFNYVFKSLDAYDEVKAKIKGIRNGLNVWKG